MSQRTEVLNHAAVQRKLERIAIQLCEETWGVKSLYMVGITPRGSALADRLVASMKKHTKMTIHQVELELDKNAPLNGPIKLSCDLSDLEDATVVLVDDVLMSGRTLMHAAAHLVQVRLNKLTTVVLVDRRHRAYPIRADIVGLTLSTTMQEHITVQLAKKDAVYLA